MDNQKYLYEEIKLKAYDLRIVKPTIPAYITDNLKHNLWDWQVEALENFLIYDKIKEKENTDGPTHLMFNMATGTGKTLMMAALILYYYKHSYRHFMFFVNQNNIVDKTENNFIDKSHTKYLFQQNVIVEDKIVNIRKVEVFDDTDDIQIKFTSIHKLHNAVYIAKENSVTLEELQKRDLVMIGDEAHHLNVSTMRNGEVEFDLPTELKENASEKKLEKSWENTVLNKILGKDNKRIHKNRNVLLEFTATIPKNEDVIEKYRTKTIYKFELVDFLQAGYTKEINLISTSLKKKDKILLALLFNWYRHEIAIKYKIPNFKPVILFRSKFIEESKIDYEEFLSLIKDLKPSDFNFRKSIAGNLKVGDENKAHGQGKSRVMQMLQFIKEENIKLGEIVDYIQYSFSEINCIITNSKDNKAKTKEKTTEDQEQLLNSLEDKNNHIRAIFTVKRLTEGWDVLNLFDIVRLYEGRDEGHDKKTGKRKAGEATVQEIQLIGRGVRYYPFSYNDYEINKRKLDNDLGNPLRVIEEFYYHSDDDHRYLDELKRELKNKGFIQDNHVVKKFALKEEFKQSSFYKEIKIWKNERINNPERRKKTLSELEKDFIFEYKTKDFVLREEQVILDKDEDEILAESKKRDRRTISVKIKDFETHLVAKAINKKAAKDLSLLRFNNLKKELNLESVDNLFSDDFIGNFKVDVITTEEKIGLDDIDYEEQLHLLLGFFDQFTKELKEISNPYKGTEKFEPFSFEDLFGETKEKNVFIDDESKRLEAELLQHKWYVLNSFNGTSEERNLLEFLKNKIVNLKEKYEQVYLLRNEEVYKIYDLEGRGFEPDFLLFLKGDSGNLYYQVFIEPKGSQFADKNGRFKEAKEGWKEEILEKITKKYSDDKILKVENKEYKLIGLPLYNYKNSKEFKDAFDKIIEDNSMETKKPTLFFNDLIVDEDMARKDKYSTHLPVYSLQAVATAFSEEQKPELLGWKKIDAKKKLDKHMFVAQVVGRSMEPTIPDGSPCMFRFDQGGSRNGKVVLVESRQVTDPETDQKFTIKRYQSEKEELEDGQWRHTKIILSPDNKEFDNIVLENVFADDFHVVAEFITIL